MTGMTKSDNDLFEEIKNLKDQISKLQQDVESKDQHIETLAKNLHLYELASDGATDGLWDWNLRTKEKFVSKPWKKMLGYEDEELSNVAGIWKGLLHPEDLERAHATIHNYINGKIDKYEIEFRMKHKNGSYRWIYSKGKLLRDELGEPYRVSGSHTDITERKIAEAALIRSERKYRNLFENSLVGMLRFNFDGRILEANSMAYSMFKSTNEKNTNVDEFFADKEDFLSLLNTLKDKGTVENQELQLRKKDGTLFWATVSGVLYKEEGFIEAVANDITATKENLLELQKVNFELDNFVYHASHDLRSPLRSILGLVNILRMEEVSKEQENCIELIEGSIKRMDKLVVDLLSISRNNRVNDAFTELNFITEINNSINNFYHASKDKKLKILAHVSQPVPFVSDLTRIRIIFNNLISNAIKYRSFDRDQSFINITVKVDREKASVVIEDNGEGIPESKLSTVFDMFVRASESSEGSGLGLYIVKDVILKLNGKVDLTSTENVGTTFSLEIPNLYEDVR